jgi:NADH-quinone oxidoreductase subunit J
MEMLHKILCSLLILSAIMASFSINPVESVLFLILCFCISGCILFMFNVEFLALVYIVVYVGAVAVLFLFVIMMLNVKAKTGLFERILNFKLDLRFLVIVSCLISVISVLNTGLSNVFSSEIVKHDVNFINLIDSLYNIDIFGQVLFNYYTVHFLFAGLVLLVALVGSILITLNCKNSNFRI